MLQQCVFLKSERHLLYGGKKPLCQRNYTGCQGSRRNNVLIRTYVFVLDKFTHSLSGYLCEDQQSQFMNLCTHQVGVT